VVFSAMILVGLLAGNSAQVIILRAVAGLFCGLVLGSAAGAIGMVLIRDNVPSPAPPALPAPQADAAPRREVPTVS
jgi:MFS family permease